jgi:hypothetical protein
MKFLSPVFRHPTRAALLALLAVTGFFAGCTGEDYSAYDDRMNESFGYSASVYSSWGYYGNPYYGYGGGGAVIITTPPRPAQPIARPRTR